MKTLKEHNAEKFKEFKSAPYEKWRTTGVECPTCGLELMYDTTYTLTSNPPQKRVACECGYVGSMY